MSRRQSEERRASMPSDNGTFGEHVTIPQESDDRHAPPATVVIFGASGDLTRRKLIPAIESLARHNRLTERFAVVGVARTPMDDDQFISAVLGDKGLSGMPQLAGAVRYIAGGYDDPET